MDPMPLYAVAKIISYILPVKSLLTVLQMLFSSLSAGN